MNNMTHSGDTGSNPANVINAPGIGMVTLATPKPHIGRTPTSSTTDTSQFHRCNTPPIVTSPRHSIAEYAPGVVTMVTSHTSPGHPPAPPLQHVPGVVAMVTIHTSPGLPPDPPLQHASGVVTMETNHAVETPASSTTVTMITSHASSRHPPTPLLQHAPEVLTKVTSHTSPGHAPTSPLHRRLLRHGDVPDGR